MTVEYLIETYGYIALFLGIFVEGEVVLVLGGFLAHRGYLALPLVMLVAFVGGTGSDQFYFNMARWRGKELLERHPIWAARMERADRLVQKYGNLIIFGFRFLYGTRIAVPILLGMGSVPRWRFVVLNMAGAAAWAVTFSTLGYLFGDAMELLLGRIKEYELIVALAIALFALVLWTVRHLRQRHQRKLMRRAGKE
jgi:membrane protein DedA with SNARE-associated domain